MLIALTNGLVAVVDDADGWLAEAGPWYATASGPPRAYAGSRAGLMHRLLLAPGDSECVDHINGDRLDNRRSNLRIVTHQQNQWHRGKTCLANATSRFKGVSYYAPSNSWKARIRFCGRQLSLGYYRTEQDAAMAYDAAAKRLHGQFAFTNFS